MRFNLLSIVVSTTLFALAKAQGVQNAENPFTAPVGDVTLVAGQPYNIAWKADTPGTVSLGLWKGPAGNLIFVKTIATNIGNTGTYSWTPESDLEGLQTMAAGSGYGFQIVNDATKNFDWSGHWQLQNAASTFNSAAGASSSAASSTAPATSSAPSSTSALASTETSSVAPSSSSSVSTTETSSVAPTTAASTTSSETASSTSSIVPATTSSASSTESSTGTTSASTTPAPTSSSTPASATSTSSTEASSTSATPSLSTASSSPTHPSSSESASSSPSATAATASTSGKLSTYAIAGISVGAIAILAGLLLGLFILRRRAQTKRESVMFGTKTPGAYDAEFAMMERRQRESGGFLNSGYNRMSSGRDFREIGQASSTF